MTKHLYKSVTITKCAGKTRLGQTATGYTALIGKERVWFSSLTNAKSYIDAKVA